MKDSVDAQPLVKFDDRFIIVDDINYHPEIDFMDYNKLGIGNTEFDPIYGIVGKDGRNYCYNIKSPNFENKKDYKFLQMAAIGTTVPLLGRLAGKLSHSQWIKMVHSGDFLQLFLDNTGQQYVLTKAEMREIILTAIGNLHHYQLNVNTLLSLCEETVVDGKSLILSSNTDDNFHVTCYTQKHCDEVHAMEGAKTTDVALDWAYSIGEAFGGMVCEVTRNGSVYTATYKYCLMDYYEWGYHVHGGDKSQHMLHECGLAMEYPIFGSLTATITWEKGYRISTLEEIQELVNQ